MFKWFREDKKRIRLTFALAALFVANAFDWLFVEGGAGLGWVIFFVSSMAVYYLLSFSFGTLKNKKASWLLVPYAILLADILVYSNDLVRFFGPVVLVILSLIIITLSNLSLNNKQFYFTAIPWLKDFGNFIALPLKKIPLIFNDLFDAGKLFKTNKLRKIALGLLVTIPVVLLFISLFSQADAIFKDVVSRLTLPQFDFLWFPHLVRTILLAIILTSGFYIVLDDEHELFERERTIKMKDPFIVNFLLVAVNAVFLLFVVIQVRYLFGSTNYVFGNDLTFAQYARNGFFELVKVMVVCGLLLTVLLRPFLSHGYPKLTKYLKLLLVAQVLVVAVSALKRMYLYQDVYGFTTLRLYVEWFIYLSMTAFLIIAYFIVAKRGFREYWHTMLLFSLLAFVGVCSLNVDGMIAKKNVDRAISGKMPLDAYYILMLSPDAWPELLKAEKQNVKLKSAFPAYDDWKRVKSELGIKYALFKKYNWRDYNVGVARFIEAYESK